MLAYYLTWHLKAAWKPLSFTDEDRPDTSDPIALQAEALDLVEHSRRSVDTTRTHRTPTE